MREGRGRALSFLAQAANTASTRLEMEPRAAHSNNTFVVV